MYRLLVEDNRDVTHMLESAVQGQPFQLICHRLLHHVDNEYLFYFLSGILSRSRSHDQLQQLQHQKLLQLEAPEQAGVKAKAQLHEMLSLMLFGLISFKDLDTMLVVVAAAFHVQDVVTSLQDAGKLQVSCHPHHHYCTCAHGKLASGQAFSNSIM